LQRLGESRAMDTVLTRLFGLDIPLIQAPMAGVSTPAMAAAVSNSGGLGSLALGALNAEAARAMLAETRALTERPFSANVFVHPTPVRDPMREAAFLAALAPAFAAAGAAPPTELREIYRSFNDDDAMLDVLLEARPAAVSLHFGAAAPERMQALGDAGIRTLATATTVAEAGLLAASGVDVLVMQSYDAGGHSGAFLGSPDPMSGGRAGLVNLIRETARCVDLPLVAAGGLMDGADIREVLDAGAAGAQLGTAFIGTPESLAGDEYRQMLKTSKQTEITEVISGRPARGLINPLMTWAGSVNLPVPDYPFTYDAVKQLVALSDDPTFSVMWAGTGAGRTRDLPVQAVLQRIADVLNGASD